MFDFSWSEILVIGIVALVVIGPKELPGVLRTLGQWMGKVRRMASDFQNQFQEAIREAELADLKKEVEDMATQATATDPAYFDPLRSVKKDLESAQREVETALAGAPGADAQGSASGSASSASSAAAADGGEATPAAAPPGAAPAEPAAAQESVPVAPADEPNPAAEHAGGSDRR